MKTQDIIGGLVLLLLLLCCGSRHSPSDRSALSPQTAQDTGRRESRVGVENVHWYGQAAFRIADAGKQIYIDPWKLPSGLPKADYIFITHGHGDHFSPDDIAAIQKKETVFVVPEDVARELRGSVKAVVPGQTLQVDSLNVVVVPAYNLTKKFHPKANKWVGYVITLSNGEKIYHAGDTDFIPEMKSIKVDIALLPCGGTYTMDAKEAAEAANVIQPKVLVPMHYGDVVGSDKDAETVKQLYKGETVVKEREK